MLGRGIVMDQPKWPSKKTGRRYITGFDGLRSLAVIGVIVYHLSPNALKGGYLGVPIFLLLAGYLVTNQMIGKLSANQPIGVGNFYLRRLKRLYPTLLSMLILTITYITLFQRNFFYQLKEIFVTNVLFVYNWWEVSHGQSYFDRFNGESPFTHLWTMGVEVQFYLIWPLLLILLFKLLRDKHQISMVVLAMSVASAILMAVLYDPQNINRAYYGTDTRAFSFLLGAWLAFVWPADRLRAQLKPKARRLIDGVGLISLLIVILMYFVLSGEAAFTYYGGMYIFSIFAMVLMGVIAHPGSHLNRWFTNPIFTWIGKRSYGIYVYQFPVLIFYESHFKNMGTHPWVNAIIEVAIILVISELSYRFIERPIAKFDWKTLPAKIKALTHVKENYRPWFKLAPAIIVVIIAIVGIVQSPAQKPNTALQKRIEQNEKALKAHNAKVKAGQATTKVGSSEIARKYGLSNDQVAATKKLKVTAVGDSVLADGSSNLQEIIPNIYISAKVGRQAYQAPAIVSSLKAEGHLQDIVVLNLGSNGTISDDDANKMLKTIGTKRQVYWITTHVPSKPWQKPVNDKINKLSKTHSNVHVIDWYSASIAHRDWFYDDNVHPNVDGNTQFAKLIVTEILKDQ